MTEILNGMEVKTVFQLMGSGEEEKKWGAWPRKKENTIRWKLNLSMITRQNLIIILRVGTGLKAQPINHPSNYRKHEFKCRYGEVNVLTKRISRWDSKQHSLST